MIINFLSLSLLFTFTALIDANYNQNLVTYCKKQGLESSKDNEECRYTLEVKGSMHQLKECEKVFVESCRRKQKIEYCIQGTHHAIDFNKCIDANGALKHLRSITVFNDCCKACIAGMNAGEKGSCIQQFDENMILNATYSCCQLKRPRRSADTKPDPPPDLLQTKLCSSDVSCPKNSICVDDDGTNNCLCIPGYFKHANGSCVDMDQDTAGSEVDYDFDGDLIEGEYTDEICSPGFKRNPSNKQCEDENECEIDNICGETGDCINTEGSFYCSPKTINGTQCPKGYEFVENSCKDIDECLNQNTCSDSQICENTDGSYFCSSSKGFNEIDMNELEPTFDYNCESGFEFDNNLGFCKDIDECETELHNCNSTSNCKNTEGSFVCEVTVKCDTGFELSSDGNCVQKNTEIKTTPQPTCDTGYKYNATTKNCDDINECMQSKKCKDTEECVNLKGSYKCRLFCGFGMRENHGLCVDIDECAEGTYTCPPNQQCFNKENGYECKILTSKTTKTNEGIKSVTVTVEPNTEVITIAEKVVEVLTEVPQKELEKVVECELGFEFNNKTNKCEDVNECLSEETHVCGYFQKCKNTNGSYICEDKECQPGFEIGVNGECVEVNCGKGKIFDKDLNLCVDLNECDQNPCKDDEDCVNISGSYRCQNSTKCSNSYKRSLLGHCVDINECEENTHNCTAENHEKCVNDLGSFHCVCVDGFERNETSGLCEDIDECIGFSLNSCIYPKNHCRNTIGGYNCECTSGFVLMEGDCKPTNSCASNPCTSGTICNDLHGSYTCDCPAGYEFDNMTNSCNDINECERQEAQWCDNCANTVGSYKCSCIEGREMNFDDDRQNCFDINECVDSKPCKENELCTNLYPGHRCTPIICDEPYTQHPSKKQACLKSTSNKDINNPIWIHYHAIGFRNNYTISSDGLPLYTIHIKDVKCKFVHQLDSVTNLDVNAKKSFDDSWKLEIHSDNEATLVLRKSLIGPQDIKIIVDCNAMGFIAHRSFIFVYVSKSDY